VSRKTILIVEDRPEIRKLVTMALRTLPYEVIEADSGEAGLKKVVELRPDLVLLDVMMPGHLDGLSVCRAIKGNPELAAIPVVMVSALTQASDLKLAREAGADDYLTKPFSLFGLMVTINRLIGKQSADRE
jgi:DNA-binding response OmpR family regulator